MLWAALLAGSGKPPERPSRVARAHKDAGNAAGEGVSILIVEDEFLVAMTIENELADAGFAVAGVAATADEAVSLARAANPKLVIMDVRLAGKGDGVDAALRIFAESGTRSVFATANADAAVRERAAAARPLGWLQKPYNGSALIAAVREALKLLAEG